MKVLARAAILPIVARCQLDKGLFDTELLLRAERAGLRIVETPTSTHEIRPPRDAPAKKILRVAGDLWRLRRALGEDGARR
jgi:hypothetical protein